MMSFGPKSGKRHSSGQKGNVFAQTNMSPPRGPKNQQAPRSSAAPQSTAQGGGGGRRSLPWSASNPPRFDVDDQRPSAPPDTRRGPKSEYEHFHKSWQALISVQREGSSEAEAEPKAPRCINVLGWVLDGR